MTSKTTKSQGDPDCESCKGSGYVPLQEGDPEYDRLKLTYGDQVEAYLTSRRCDCLEEKRFHARVGTPIFNADIIESDLFDKLETRNAFVFCAAPDFLAHLRAFLKKRPLTYHWKMATDMDLLDIFLGKREEWNSIGNFSKGPELLVLRLGFQSFGNKALPGQVLECLKTREMLGKTTWVINPHDLPFDEKHHLAYSPSLEWYLDENYTRVNIKPERVRKVSSSKTPMTVTRSNSQQKEVDAKSAAKYQNIKIF